MKKSYTTYILADSCVHHTSKVIKVAHISIFTTLPALSRKNIVTYTIRKWAYIYLATCKNAQHRQSLYEVYIDNVSLHVCTYVFNLMHIYLSKDVYTKNTSEQYIISLNRIT